MSRPKLIVANLKMNGSRESHAALMAGILNGWHASECAPAVICPAHPYVDQVARQLAGSALCVGGQDVATVNEGAYTGEVSAAMLADLGCQYAIVGHSERRTHQGETDAQVLAKTRQSLANRLTPIICVGETRFHYESAQTERVVMGQLQLLLDGLVADDWSRVVLAYEPLWAIGTGQGADPLHVERILALIRRAIYSVAGEVANELVMLYGGSVNPENAAQLRAMPDVDGALVGKAALVAKDFVGICRSFA